jgi:hypothetical protein
VARFLWSYVKPLERSQASLRLWLLSLHEKVRGEFVQTTHKRIPINANAIAHAMPNGPSSSVARLPVLYQYPYNDMARHCALW